MGIRNDCIDAVMSELSRFGIQGVLGERGKHMEIRWRYASGQERFIIVPKSPSDHRASLNARGDTRRLLKEDNVQPPAPQVVQFQKAMSLPRPDDLAAVRLRKLEEDFVGLLDWVGDLDVKLNEVLARLAKEHGVKIVINTDSHHTSHMEKIRFGILQARRAWLTHDDVLNTLPPQKFAKAMKHTW